MTGINTISPAEDFKLVGFLFLQDLDFAYIREKIKKGILNKFYTTPPQPPGCLLSQA